MMLYRLENEFATAQAAAVNNAFAAAQSPPLSDLTQYINPNVKNTRVQNALGNHIQGFQRKPSKPDSYKTVMCQAWLESMKCTFGENCKFAHGEQELRPAKTQIRNHLKYKTKLCEKYTTSGICPYGSRCLFIHPAPQTTTATQMKPEMQFNKSGPQRLPMRTPVVGSPLHGAAATDLLDTSLLFNQTAEAVISFLYA